MEHVATLSGMTCCSDFSCCKSHSHFRTEVHSFHQKNGINYKAVHAAVPAGSSRTSNNLHCNVALLLAGQSSIASSKQSPSPLMSRYLGVNVTSLYTSSKDASLAF